MVWTRLLVFFLYYVQCAGPLRNEIKCTWRWALSQTTTRYWTRESSPAVFGATEIFFSCESGFLRTCRKARFKKKNGGIYLARGIGMKRVGEHSKKKEKSKRARERTTYREVCQGEAVQHFTRSWSDIHKYLAGSAPCRWERKHRLYFSVDYYSLSQAKKSRKQKEFCLLYLTIF